MTFERASDSSSNFRDEGRRTVSGSMMPGKSTVLRTGKIGSVSGIEGDSAA
jgi:hypothetical protein